MNSVVAISLASHRLITSVPAPAFLKALCSPYRPSEVASEIATTLFMNKFYESLLANGFDKHSAFNDARAAVRARYPEPYYGAGFVMVD